MITFNLHTKDRVKDFTIDSQFTLQPKNTINYKGDFFIVEEIEYVITEETINQIVICVSK